MHIVLFHFYSHKPNPVYQEIAEGLRRRGHIVWLGAPNDARDLEWHDGTRVVATIPGPRVPSSAPSFRWHYFRFMWRVRRFLIQEAPDMIQVNPSLMAWLLARGLPKGTHAILDIRQINEAVNRRLTTKIKEWRDVTIMKINAGYLFEHTCFCHQEAARRILGETWARRSTVVPVGIDPEFLETANPAPGAVRQPSDRVRFVYIGTLSRLRNLQHLLAAAKRLKEEGVCFQLDLIGPDAANRYYHTLIDEWQIDDVAAVYDPVPYEEVPTRLLTYDVGLAYVPDRPTWHYQPTIKVLEYRALGIPILSTDVATHRETVEAGVNGLLTQDRVESLAEAMKRFATDRQFLAECTRNAQAMRRGLTWAEVVRMYDEQVYQPLRSQ